MLYDMRNWSPEQVARYLALGAIPEDERVAVQEQIWRVQAEGELSGDEAIDLVLATRGTRQTGAISRKPVHATVCARALQLVRERGWRPRLEDDDYQRIAAAGFYAKTLPLAFVAVDILEQLQPLTVRGLLYQLVSAGWVESTSLNDYNKVDRLTVTLREREVIPFDWIVDDLRVRLKPSSWSGLADYGETVRDCYRKDFWEHLPVYLEFFVEKNAMAGVLQEVTEQYDVALLAYEPAELRALIKDLYGGVPKLQDFDRFRMPADGTTRFTIATPAGEQQPRTLSVVLIQAQRKRAFWARPFSGTGIAPDCRSNDGRIGEGAPGGTCALCPHAHFGEDGGAPACRESLDLVHLGINEEQPSILDVHKMSVGAVEKYLRGLRKWSMAPHSVVTELGLVAAKYENGFEYTKLTLRAVGPLSPSERERMRAAAAAFGLAVSETASDGATGTVFDRVVDVPPLPPEDDVPF